MKFHSYADDTQLYVHCRPEEIAAATATLERCIMDMDCWMSVNRLKLNMHKTELSMLNYSGPSLQLNNVTVNASQHVCVVRVHLSSDLSPDKHVSSASTTCFYHLRQLRGICVRLTPNACRLLDYRNAILAVALKTMRRLQRVLNAAARDWLDISERVNYKLEVLTHRCLLGKAPVYLSNCCIPGSPVASRRHLHSAARHQLTVPRHRLSTYGQRAFEVAGPMMFNALPDDLRDPTVSTATFRRSLKTQLFSAYQHL